jgi:hypothetical protein
MEPLLGDADLMQLTRARVRVGWAWEDGKGHGHGWLGFEGIGLWVS